MKHTVFVLAILCSAIAAQAEGNQWEKLWRNADQRGEQLLRRGDAAAAAKIFTDPRRKAYAELSASDYTQAAQTLNAFDDGDAHYNRGNALAHAGKLQDALKAYDAALARDPNNQDARHNRDLVATALKQNPPEKQNSGDRTRQDEKDQGKPESDQKPTAPNQDQGGKQQDGQTGKNANGGTDGDARSSTNEPAQSEKASEGTGATPHAPEAKTRGSAKAQPGKSGQGESDKSHTSPSASTPAGQAPDTAGEAHRDAAASLNPVQAAPSPAGKPGAGRLGNDSEARLGQAGSAPRPSEQQLAQDQWLRSIPDDPGGLLRRKFLIEHLMRKQKSQP